jgi:hypothetical protein
LLLGTDPFTFTQFAENWILCLCHSLNLNVSLQKCLLGKRAKKTFLCCFQQFPITIKPFFGWIFDQTKLSLHFFYASVVRHQHYHPFWRNLEGGRFFFFFFFLFSFLSLGSWEAENQIVWPRDIFNTVIREPFWNCFQFFFTALWFTPENYNRSFFSV